MGVFARIIKGLASDAAEQKTAMSDATYLKARRMGRAIGRMRGEDELIRGINSPRGGAG